MISDAARCTWQPLRRLILIPLLLLLLLLLLLPSKKIFLLNSRKGLERSFLVHAVEGS